MAAALCLTEEQLSYKFVSRPNMRKYWSNFEVAVETMEGFRGHKKSLKTKRVGVLLPATADYSSRKWDLDLNVPAQLYDLSLMSPAERIQLCKRLKLELQQVRSLFKNIESKTGHFIANAVSLSSEMPNGMGFQSRGSKKSEILAVGKRRKRVESCEVAAKRRKDDRPDPIIMNQCGTILRRLMLHKYAYVFNTPVDIVALNIPDYFNVIRKPMDLGTIKQKLDRNCYLYPIDFATDVRLTFTNALTYNPPGNDVHYMAGVLSEIFENKWRSMTRKLPEVEEPATKKLISTKQKQQQGQKKLFPPNYKVNNKPRTDPIAVEQLPIVKRLMTAEEKLKLSRDLESLCDMPQQIMEFLRVNGSHVSQNEDEIEIDVDAFSNEALLQLQELVTNYLRNNAAKKHLKAEPVIRLPPGNSNCSTVNNIKGDEDDVDIGENDLPASSSYPAVEIERDKDTVGRSSKGASFSCSSTDSGSSSSDSGSSDAAPKAPSPKEPRGCDAACNQTSIPSLDTHGAKRAESGLDEESAHSKLPPASSERQVSPDKLYRAALLRSRFADTILKAQEKTLSQGDNGDPQKLRREREELERRQREEKARLQAEAMAAERARVQAEAMAAAEAKRKLEIERGAARLALQQMEKTVEIDENTQVLKDLEMFRTSQADHIPSSGDELSPHNSHDRLEPFPLHGRNPLEQLGLFMKRDEEEEEEMGLFMKRDEEEVIASSVPRYGDVEEGEID